MVSRRIHDYDDPGPKSHFEAALVVVCVFLVGVVGLACKSYDIKRLRHKRMNALFNVLIQFENHTQVEPCQSYKEALDRAEFETERFPDAVVTVEPAF